MRGYRYKRPTNEEIEPVWRDDDSADSWQQLGVVIQQLRLDRPIPVDTYMLQRLYPKR